MTDTAPEPTLSPDELWALARDLYLEGHTGQTICRDLGVAPSTFWKRAHAGGWLRRDTPRPSPELEPLDESAPATPPDGAVDKAWRRVCHALDQGRSSEALRWMRVHAGLARLPLEKDRRELVSSRRAIDALGRTGRAIEAQARAALSVRGLQLRSDDLEKGESVSPDSSEPGPPAPHGSGPLSRAQRRRLARSGRDPARGSGSDP